MTLRWRIAQTEEEKQDVYRIRSVGYRQHYRNIPQGTYSDELDEALLPDGRPRASSVMALEGNILLGTMRNALLYTSSYTDLDSEVNFLFDLKGQTLPQIMAKHVGRPVTNIGEISRFTIAPQYRGKTEIMEKLFAGSIHQARAWQLDVFIAIGKEWVIRHVNQVGAGFQKITDLPLNRNDPQALRFMIRYHEYFLPNLVKKYPQVATPQFLETTTLTHEALLKMVNEAQPEDDVAVYWVTPQRLAEGTQGQTTREMPTIQETQPAKTMRPVAPIDLADLPMLRADNLVFNPFNLEDDAIKTAFHDRLARRIVVLPKHEEFYATLTSRNYPFVSMDQQHVLKNAKVAIAGQGTVGGNLAISMLRYGFENFRIADIDEFDVSNLNRQPTNLFGIGENKASHNAYQMLCINPFANIEVSPPLSDENLEAFVKDADVVVSALDNVQLIIKLNQVALKYKKPVLLGTDVGSRVLLDVFDYRHTDKLLNGRITEDDLNLPYLQLVMKIIHPEKMPVEMLEAMMMRMGGKIDYFAQTVVSASVCSAVLIEGLKFVLLNKPIQQSTYIDVIDSVALKKYKSLRQSAWNNAVTQLRATMQAMA